MSELKRCPICDKEVEITKDNLMGFHVIECNICKILMYSRNKEELINKWNTRKPMQNIVERLEHFNEETFYRANGRTNGKTLAYGYSKGIRKAIEIVKEEGEL